MTLHTAGGDVRKLDFRFYAGNKKIGAPFHGLKAFFTTGQLNLLDKVPFLHKLHEDWPDPSLFSGVTVYLH